MRVFFKTLLLGGLAFVVFAFASVNVRAEEVKGPCVVSAKAKEIAAFVEPKFVESNKPISMRVTANLHPDKYNVAAVARLPIRSGTARAFTTAIRYHNDPTRILRPRQFNALAKEVPMDLRPRTELIEQLIDGQFVTLRTKPVVSRPGAGTNHDSVVEFAIFGIDKKHAQEGMRATLTLIHYGGYIPLKERLSAELEKLALSNNQRISESIRSTKIYEESKSRRASLLIETESIGPLMAQLRNLRIDTAGTQARIEMVDQLIDEYRSSGGVAKLTELRITATVDLAEMKAKEKATVKAVTELEARTHLADKLLSAMDEVESKVSTKAFSARLEGDFLAKLGHAETYLPYFTEKENPVEIRPIKFVYGEE